MSDLRDSSDDGAEEGDAVELQELGDKTSYHLYSASDDDEQPAGAVPISLSLDSPYAAEEVLEYESNGEDYGPLGEQSGVADAPRPLQKSPEESAGLLSWLTFWWLNDLFRKGYAAPLEEEDMWELGARDGSREAGRRFEEAWRAEEVRGRFSAAWALQRAFGLYFWLSALWKVVYDMLQFAPPYLIRQMIIFINLDDSSAASSDSRSDWEEFQTTTGYGLLLCAGLFVTPLVETICVNLYFQRVYRSSMHVRSGIMMAVYNKSLRLSTASRQRTTVGEIVNLMSTDANRIKSLLIYLHGIWSCPLQIFFSLYFLYQLLGVAAFAGASVLVLMIPANALLARVQSKFQSQFMSAKDNRVRLMSETLQGMRVLKFFSWEESFRERISALRHIELRALRKQLYLRAVTTFLWYATPIFVSVATFALYAGLGNEMKSSVIFPAIALFNVLRFPISMLPNIINNLVTSRVSWLRIGEFLCNDDLQSIAEGESMWSSATSRRAASAQRGEGELPLGGIAVMDGSFAWDDQSSGNGGGSDSDSDSDSPMLMPEEGSDATLKEITLKVEPGQLVLVVGEVGAGKSSLLSALLGEMNRLQGDVRLQGRVAYVPQQAWMKNASLRENVLFGKQYDADLYDEVIKVCALQPDLDMLPAGDQTEIGEKGINLSGGQKQRVSIARATYQEADIYLFDDPLSAVDIHVGTHLFEQCIQQKLAGKTRILTTHQLFCLKEADSIVVMKEGRISEVGTYDQLIDAGLDFASLMEVHGSDSSAEEIETDPPFSSSLKKSLGSDEEKMNAMTNKAKSSSADQANLIKSEERDTGSVKLSIYRSYLEAAGWLFTLTTIVMSVAVQSLTLTSDWWLSYWGEQTGANDFDASSSLPDSLSDSLGSQEDTTTSDTYYELVYLLISLSAAVGSFVGSFSVFLGGLNASRLLHDSTLMHVLRAPIAFFDTTPVGRILNRFSRDQDGIDSDLPGTLASALRCAVKVASTVVLMCIAAPFLLVVVIPIGVLYYFIQAYYLRTSRELKRLDSITNSPIYSHFSETLNGVATIRAYNATERFILENEERLDQNQRCYWPSVSVNRWLGQRLEFVGALLLLIASIFAVLFRSSSDPNLVGLALTYSVSMSSALNWMVRMTTDTETQMNSVERLQHYHEIPQEAAATRSHEESLLPSDWPEQGKIEFRTVSMRYREDLDPVLQSLSFEVRPGEKVAICGRTGSGKSSMMMALFRLVELCEGEILLDDVDISSIGLHRLRTSMAMIPQDPILFQGTIRSNLDPFDHYSDTELWNALARVQLCEHVQSLSRALDGEVAENGENFSVGQRQLFCMARALLRASKIVVLDEATANIDVETDRIIQETIREECKDATVLTIAHRIGTITDYDRVLVLAAGEVVEFDSPQTLLANPNSAFAAMSKESGAVVAPSSSSSSSTSSSSS